MTVQPRKAVCEATVRKVAHRVPVIVQVGAADAPTTDRAGRTCKRKRGRCNFITGTVLLLDHTDNEIIYHFKKLGGLDIAESTFTKILAIPVLR